jgi:drug/metabolite transporter (DMT)-like permease
MENQIARSPRRDALLLIGLGFVLGSAFFWIKILVEYLTPSQFVVARLGLAAAAVLAYLAARGRTPRPTPGLVVGGSLLAVFDSVIPYGLVAWAAGSLDSGTTAVLISTMPLFTALFATALLPDERLTAARVAALLVGFAGVVVVAGTDSLDLRQGFNASHAAVIGASVSYGASTVYSRALLKRDSVVDLSAVKLTMGTLIAIPFMLMVDGVPTDVDLDAKAVGALIMLGVVSTGIARLVFLWTIAEMGSVRASVVTYLIPLSALLLGWGFLGEQPAPETYLGMALILAGSAGVMHDPAGTVQAVVRWLVGRHVMRRTWSRRRYPSVAGTLVPSSRERQ